MIKSLKRNFLFAFSAQGLQFLQSILISLLLPKLLGINEFGFWQLFVFYTQYGGFFHFGLNDGIYLKVGGKKYDDLDYKPIAWQLRLSIIIQMFFLMAIIFFFTLSNDSNRIFVIVCSCIYILISNISSYLNFILQATNRIKEFSIGRLIDIGIFVVLLISFLIVAVDNYKYIIYSCILGRIAGLFFYVTKTTDISRLIFYKYEQTFFTDYIYNVSMGFVLVISNIASMLILGVGRFMVDYYWGITAFSKVSYSIMMVNFFLLFINQASMVLFPELRTWTPKRISSFYAIVRNKLDLISPFVLLTYYPICFFVNYWIPDYKESVYFLIYLLPLCIFDSKMQLLCNTIFKVCNKVKVLLICNMLTVTLSSILVLVSICIFKNIEFVVISMLISIVFRSVISEYYLQKSLNMETTFNIFAMEIGMVVIFICIFIFFEVFTSILLNLLFSTLCFFWRSRQTLWAKA